MPTSETGYGLLRHEPLGVTGLSLGFWTTRLKPKGLNVRRHFHDQIYGAPELARQYALAWRDALLRLALPSHRLP